MGTYSDALMDHFSSPRNSGPMEDPDLVGRAGAPGKGPFMAVFIKLAGEGVGAARFQTYGCGVSIAAGSALTEMIIGRAVRDCLGLTAQDVVDALDGVPPDKAHCPVLAIAALRDALRAVG